MSHASTKSQPQRIHTGLVIFLNSGLNELDNEWNIFLTKVILRCPNPSMFLPLNKAFIGQYLEYAIQTSFPFLPQDSQALDSVVTFL